MDTKTPETKGNPCGYRARDLDLATAYQLQQGLINIRDRMQGRKDCPSWVVIQLWEMIHKTNCLLGPLKMHRDELKLSVPEPCGHEDRSWFKKGEPCPKCG